MDTIHVRMLGGFSLTWNGQELTDADNRMRKVWLLLGYLIYRRTVITPEEITALLWSDEEELNNPSGALKTMLYRVRTLLGRLGEDAGSKLVLRRDGGYIWNPEVPTVLDVQEVDNILRQLPSASESQRLDLHLQLLSLYRGDFLPKLSSESWAMPICAYYHQTYLTAAQEALAALEALDRWEEVQEISAAALKVEPYSESLYNHLIRSYLAAGEQEKALSAYETMSDLLFSNFGVLPSEESRALYRLANRSGKADKTNIASIRELLREAEPASGAMFCEYDFFRVLYQAQARAIVRSGDTIHLGLLTITGRRGAELPRRSLDRAAENLKQLLITGLRQGDIVTQCSLSQFLVMLPQANYENSCIVCQRLVKSFFRQYPHTPADLHFSVQPLEPLDTLR